MSMKRITFAKAGTAALALAFILVMAGCPTETEPVTPALSGDIAISPASGVITGTQLTAVYDGPETVTYQWKKDGVNVASGTTCTPAEAGSYTVTVSKTGFTSKTSDAVDITDTEAPGVPLAELANHIARLPQNTAKNPHIVKLDMVNISTGGVMGSIKQAVTNRYIILDLSACYASDHAISGSSSPGPNDMNYIQDNQYIVGIILPGELTTIGDSAFSGCGSLASITIPVGVTSIGERAFYRCGSLASVAIPVGVTSIRERAFYGCTGLASVTIPVGVTSIGERAFYGCGRLSSVTIPAGVTSIGEEAFEKCSSLASVIIPVGVTSIGERAFSGCTSLASVIIPEGVTSIGYGAFLRCSSLASVTIPEGVTSIGEYVFYGCSSLASVTIPGSATSIERIAFYGCGSLASVTIPGSVTSIGQSAFYNCSSLASITFALGSNISSSGFSSSTPFPGDLRAKYLASGGGAGTYMRPLPAVEPGTTGTWTKQP